MQAKNYKPGLLTTLQAGRAFAALAVVFHHAVLSVDQIVDPISPDWYVYFKFGYLGVDFFFVLSGFIIFYSTAAMEQTASQTAEKSISNMKAFSTSRLIRIFAPYLPVTFALIMLYVLLPSLSQATREWGYLTSIFLLPSQKETALIVAWTLQHELVFYLYFALIFYSGNLLKGCILWLIIIALGAVLGFGESKPYKFFTALINLEFLFGMAAAWVVLNWQKLSIILFLILSIVTFLGYLALGAETGHRVIFGLSLALLLIPVSKLELNGKLHSVAWIVFLGNASYAIYLTHTPALSVLSRIFAKVPSVLNWPVALVAGIAIATGIGCVYHLLIEKPVLKALREKIG